MVSASARKNRPARGWGNAPAFWKTAQWVYLTLFFVCLYAPIVLLAVLSFNDSNIVGLPIKGFTVQWYSVLFTDSVLQRALYNSATLGVVSAAISTTLALLMILGFQRNAIFKNFLLQAILIPIAIPGVVGGIILVLFFGYLNAAFGLWTTTLVAHVNWSLPFAFLTLYPRMHAFDRSLEEAAMDLGATPFVTFRRIVFPLVSPAILATFLFAFTLSFDEFIRTLFLIGTERTVPVHLWILVVQEMSPFMPAVGMTITAITIVASVAGFWLSSLNKSKPTEA